jgi:predicted transcriptional regulator YdeE
MSYSLVSRPAFSVVGISARTSNETAHEIGELWQRFYAEGAAKQIPHPESSAVYSLYTEYETDSTGLYTLIIGYPAPAEAPPSPGWAHKSVPAADYAVFSAAGKAPYQVVEAWRTIWNSDIRRSYSGDFEVYSPGGGAEEEEGVKIYVALSKAR